jgi:hypothetical protein
LDVIEGWETHERVEDISGVVLREGGDRECMPDGRAIHDMYLFKVKRLEAFRPIDQGGCQLLIPRG